MGRGEHRILCRKSANEDEMTESMEVLGRRACCGEGGSGRVSAQSRGSSASCPPAVCPAETAAARIGNGRPGRSRTARKVRAIPQALSPPPPHRAIESPHRATSSIILPAQEPAIDLPPAPSAVSGIPDPNQWLHDGPWQTSAAPGTRPIQRPPRSPVPRCQASWSGPRPTIGCRAGSGNSSAPGTTNGFRAVRRPSVPSRRARRRLARAHGLEPAASGIRARSAAIPRGRPASRS